MSLFAELKRRNVIRVGAAYAIVAWVLAQIAEFAFENFGAPDWVLKSVVVVLLLGLPLALFFAWAFEMTPDGLKREAEVDRSQSITRKTGRKLDHVIIGVLVLALGWFTWDKFFAATGSQSLPATTAQETTSAESHKIAMGTAAEKSVAVLPFIAMSNGPDDEYFADGLTEEILNSLAQLPELLVTARTSAFSFKDQDIPVQEIATALGVQHIVEGSVRRSGDRLRVTAQLIRAEDAFHLWSENYDSTSTDTIAVQEDIAEKIAAALDVVLDEKKRTAMRKAGLRDVEAFTIYQKGLEVSERAHGEIKLIEGLRQANAFFDQVIQRVPEFSQVYADHSDLFAHILTDDANARAAAMPAEKVASAYAAAIADFEAAERYAKSPGIRRMTELDLAFVSGKWRGMGGRIQRAMEQPGCYEGNWTPVIANVFGYSKQHLERSYGILKCDPRRSLSWFNTARSALKTGDKEEALRIAREGSDIAPGAWLATVLVRALVANGLHEEARRLIDDQIQDVRLAQPFKAMVAAHEGDQARTDALIEQFRATSGTDYFFMNLTAAWSGNRDETNRVAATIDQHPFGSVALVSIAHWCDCGAPWDLESTPNFAAKLKESGLPWPPPPALQFPLKDW
jgi:adenylate cyclase